MVSILDTGAVAGEDCTAAIQAAIDVAAPHEVTIPGSPLPYCTSAPLVLAPGVRLVGEGRTASVIAVGHPGDGVVMSSPLGGSTPVDCTVRDLGLTCTVSGSTGAAIHDSAGTYWLISDVEVGSGFAQAVRLNQSECVDIVRLRASGALAAGIWLENSGWLTNVIRIQSCTLLADRPGTVGVLDDGGACHTIADCNVEGFDVGVQVAWSNLLISGGDFECANHALAMSETNSTGATGGPVTRVAIVNASLGASTSAPINGCAYGHLALTNVGFATGATDPHAVCNAGGLASLSSVNSHFFGPMPLVDVAPPVFSSFGDGA